MRIAFFSTMAGLPWGGSEELWCRAAHVLLERGHEVHFNSFQWDSTAAPLTQLTEAGAKPTFRTRVRLGRTLRRALEILRIVRVKYMGWLRKTKPDFVVISFSCHTDDPQIAITCRTLGIPYAILLQAAGPHNWIAPRSVADYRNAYEGAARCFFVSNENRVAMESNMAIELPNFEIVDNPFAVSLDAAPAWPASEPDWKLACVARISFLSKSQDLIIRVMKQPKWRSRPLKVVLWGNDDGFLARFQDLIKIHRLENQVSYGGFSNSVEDLWANHHGLLLPSRTEGNPLALVEAMLCGRIAITTNVGRAAELIDDNKSGFIAPAATEELIDEVLERAWQRRHKWQSMGQLAARAVRQRHSLRPAEDFADRIVSAAAAAGLATAKQRAAA